MKASGRFVLRIDPELHEELRHEAHARKISLNELVASCLRDTTKRAPKIIDQIHKIFQNQLIGVIVFGSTVRGEDSASSDIDLLLVLEEDTPINRSLYRTWDSKVAPVVGEKCSPQFTHLPRTTDQLSSLWLEVGLEGEILDDRKKVLRKTLSAIKRKIVDGTYRRKTSHGHPYWIHEKGLNAE